MDAICEDSFWIILEISWRVCAPWSNLRKLLQQHGILQRRSGMGALASLVFWKASGLRSDIVALTSVDAWNDWLED